MTIETEMTLNADGNTAQMDVFITEGLFSFYGTTDTVGKG